MSLRDENDSGHSVPGQPAASAVNDAVSSAPTPSQIAQAAQARAVNSYHGCQAFNVREGFAAVCLIYGGLNAEAREQIILHVAASCGLEPVESFFVDDFAGRDYFACKIHLLKYVDVIVDVLVGRMLLRVTMLTKIGVEYKPAVPPVPYSVKNSEKVLVDGLVASGWFRFDCIDERLFSTLYGKAYARTCLVFGGARFPDYDEPLWMPAVPGFIGNSATIDYPVTSSMFSYVAPLSAEAIRALKDECGRTQVAHNFSAEKARQFFDDCFARFTAVPSLAVHAVIVEIGAPTAAPAEARPPPAPPAAKKRRSDDDDDAPPPYYDNGADADADDFLCMICMENPPDTIVHPCKH